jgi:hypothetical protein
MSIEDLDHAAIARAAERAGLRASDVLDIAHAADDPVTDPAAYVAQLAEQYPGLRTAPAAGQPHAKPEETEDERRQREGREFLSEINQSRKNAGKEPFPIPGGGTAA